MTNSYIYADGQILKQNNYGASYSYYYIHDRLGSIRQVIRSDGPGNYGFVVNSYTYNPFGEMIATECTEQFYNPFKFTGQWFDAEIGQYPLGLGTRMYDPQLMRLTSRDPDRGFRKESMTLHKYLYCLNDPINRTDPTGRYSAAALVAPIIAGYETHALAIAFVAYGVANDRDFAIGLGIAIEQSIGAVMALVSIGVNYGDALVHAVKQKDRDNFGKLKEIGKEYGKTLEEVLEAIHNAKRRGEHKGKPHLTDDEIRKVLEE